MADVVHDVRADGRIEPLHHRLQVVARAAIPHHLRMSERSGIALLAASAQSHRDGTTWLMTL